MLLHSCSLLSTDTVVVPLMPLNSYHLSGHTVQMGISEGPLQPMNTQVNWNLRSFEEESKMGSFPSQELVSPQEGVFVICVTPTRMPGPKVSKRNTVTWWSLLFTSLVSGLNAVTDWELGHMVQQQSPVNHNHDLQSFKYGCCSMPV